MAIALATMYTLATDQNTAQTKIAAAAAIAAQAVLIENGGSPPASRLAWAQKTLNDPLSMAKKMIWGVLADANVQAAGANASDAVIQASVNSLVSTYVNA